jgi:hypothetical protein
MIVNKTKHSRLKKKRKKTTRNRQLKTKDKHKQINKQKTLLDERLWCLSLWHINSSRMKGYQKATFATSVKKTVRRTT